MMSIERRRYPRYETEFSAMIHKDGEEVPITMIDISEGGIGIISKRGFFPGTKVNIIPENINDYAIQGGIKWARLIVENGNTHYRVGIEADGIMLGSESHAVEPPDRSEFLKRLLQP